MEDRRSLRGAETLTVLSADRRRAGERSAVLDRMHGLLRSLTSSRAEPTLVMIADCARDATQGRFAAFVIRDDGGPRVAGFSGVNGDEGMAKRAIFNGHGGGENPWVVVQETGQPLVVSDMRADNRFGAWAQGGPREFASVVLVPVVEAETVVGVLGVYFQEPGAVKEEVLQLLSTFAKPTPSDVIVRAVAAERSRENTAVLEERDRSRTTLLATVAHELRAPIQATLGFVATVLTHWDRLSESKRKELLERVLGNAEEQARLVDDLVDYSRIEAADPEMMARPCDLATLVEARVANLGPLYQNHRIVVTVPPGLSVFVDPDLLATVLSNLLGNAVKFSPAGTSIEVSASEQDGTAIISVSDNGAGISSEDRIGIFEPFHQGTGSSHDGGVGLGLALARQRVELLGGRIWIERRSGRGSTFSFSLPTSSPVDPLVPTTRPPV